MKNLYVVATLAATLAGGTLESALAQSASKTGIKNVVLVHGAFADGSGWEAVADILKKDGYTVSVVQHPETSYAEDIKFTKAVIDRQSGPVVLVGHSYGGAVITEAGNDPKVAALVYCRFRAGHWGKLRHDRESLAAGHHGDQAYRRWLLLH
jgi:pimeloyl-ACP methyl ester carboxylesterase